MRAICLTLALLMAAPAWAQGPIATAVATQYGCPCPCPDQDRDRDRDCRQQRDRDRRTRQAGAGMESPTKFYIGLGLIAAGTTLTAAAVTWQQKSDLSKAPPGSRLNINLAPCNTDPATTRMQIAECKVNQPLLWLGTGLEAAGTLLMIGGGRSTKSFGFGPRRVAVRVRF